MDTQVSKPNIDSQAAVNPAVSRDFFKSKVGMAIIALILILLLTTCGLLVYLYQNREKLNSNTDNTVTPTPTATSTPTPIMTDTPSPTPTATTITTSTPTAIPTTSSKVYTDNDVKLQFTYPSDYTVTASTFTKPTQTDWAAKVITVKKGSTILTLNFSTAPTGCYNPENHKVSALFQNTDSKEYISRNVTTEFGTEKPTGYGYGTYSSSVNGNGTTCDLISLTKKTYPDLGGVAGYFLLRVTPANISANDLSDLDALVKSMKRL